MVKRIKLSKAEKQSGISRVSHAEGLILQLPKTHDGRNTWLLNYGYRQEAVSLRKERGIEMSKDTRSAIYKGKSHE